MTEITITDGHMSHTVKTKEEAQRIIDRYFSEGKEHVHMMEFRKPIKRRISNKMLLATLAEHKEPVYKVRQLQALCYISLVLNVILLFVVFAIL
ncbi:TPA: hypothetical protein ACYK3B_001392 [Enterococcus faecium]|uniref:hypothetical protein n=1 Tax=Enterococcus faecium TaxID=1352 RepID=UPI00135F0989|nr:hypothetical protein [Enterococcus faecium]EJC3723503.1 hypothetical protein [Enterococcus faecium]MDQ8366440.1 hypothetical protein [Enterococcus faecium]MXS07216.1 hypothetical protein [Enterococcus faecium]DAJ20900.1 MAG TPA: hypothetical protein [Siphoviridae sp. ctekg1]